MKKDAIMILFLSLFKEHAEEISYTYQGEQYTGVYTSDAPTKCLLKESLKNGNQITRILCITSRDDYYKKITPEEKETTFQYYCNMAKEYYEKELGLVGKELEIVPVFYDVKEGKGIDDIEERSFYVCQQIMEQMNWNRMEKRDVYIDYTSGLRDITFLMTTLIRYLEFETASCRKIIYSNLADKAIYDLQYIYGMYQLINGVSEFVNTGSARQLKEVYVKIDHPQTREMLDSMIQFSNAMSLCAIGSIDTTMQQMERCIRNMEQAEEKQNLFVMIFKSLIPLIRKKMYLDEEKMTYPRLIEWCIHNHLLQQAITLYIEKMPVYYYETGMLNLNDDLTAIHNQGSSEESVAFYTGLFDRIEKDKNILTLEELVRRASDDTENLNRYLAALTSEKEEQSEIVKNALEKMEAIIRNQYNNNRQIYVYGKKVEERTFRDFHNTFCGYKGERYLHYFLYDNFPAYKRLPRGWKYTYRKKVAALKKLEAGDVSVQNPEQTLVIMRYYLALKYMRNRMNHASEHDLTEDETALKEYMMTKGIDVTPEFEHVKKILLEGLQHSKP